MCGIRYPTMVDFVKEKIHARFLVDNKNPNKLKKTAFEKLNETQIEIIRRRVNTILEHCISLFQYLIAHIL